MILTFHISKRGEKMLRSMLKAVEKSRATGPLPENPLAVLAGLLDGRWQRKCPECKGSGSVDVSKPRHPLTRLKRKCHGT